MKTYTEIKNEQPMYWNVFFAFSDEQFEKGRKEAGIENELIFSCGDGIYGTKEGIRKLFDFYISQSHRIAAECDPQDVYNCEFENNECDYMGNDAEAIRVVHHYFGLERALGVKRKFGYLDLKSIN